MAMAVSGWPQAKQAAPPRRFTVEVGEGKNGGRRFRGGEPSAAHLIDADAHIFASSRVNDASDSSETAAIQNGMYVAVIGSLKGLQERKRATAFSIRPITDFNEVTLHFIQCVRMHIENTKLKAGSPARTSSSMGVSVSNGFSESSTPTSLKSNPAPVTSGANGSDTDLNTQVLNIFKEPANLESEHGVHVDEVFRRFKLPKEKIMEAIKYNEDGGLLYSTIDDFHYKSASID